jgi:hypothetical protein
MWRKRSPHKWPINLKLPSPYWNQHILHTYISQRQYMIKSNIRRNSHKFHIEVPLYPPNKEMDHFYNWPVDWYTLVAGRSSLIFSSNLSRHFWWFHLKSKWTLYFDIIPQEDIPNIYVSWVSDYMYCNHTTHRLV